MKNYQKSDFEKGQTVYLYVTGNEARRTKPGIENRIREAVVKKEVYYSWISKQTIF